MPDKEARLRLYLGTLAVSAFLLHTANAGEFFFPIWRNFPGILPLLGPHFFPEWIRHLARCALALAFFASLPGAGRWLWRGKSEPLDVFLRGSLGLLQWGLAGIALAALGACSAAILRPLSACAMLAGIWFGRSDLRALAGQRPSVGPWIPIAILFALTTVVPEVFYDALVYHLAVPRAYLLAGHWVDFPGEHLARLPGMAQTIFLWGLAWSDDRLCKWINLGIGLWTAGLLAAWSARRFGAAAGRWSAAIYLTCPLVGLYLWACSSDAAAALFLLSAVALFSHGLERKDFRAAALSGLLFGAAVAAKYTALAGVPLFFLLWWRAGRPGRWAAYFAIAALLPILPWWFRNGIWTGNPFYPLATGLWGGDSADALAQLANWRQDARGDGRPWIRATSFLTASLRGAATGRFNFLGPLFLMTLPLLVWRRRDRFARNLLWGTLGAYGLFIFQSEYIRYLIPFLPVVASLSAAALTPPEPELTPANRRWFARMRRCVAAAMAANGIWMVLALLMFNQAWDVIWGRKAPAEFLREEHIGVYNQPTQGAYDFLTSRKALGRIFQLGEARTFHSPLPITAAGAFNKPIYARWLEDNPSPDAFVERLRREGYTYLILNQPELLRITPPEYLSDRYRMAMLAVFQKLGPPQYNDNWSLVFAIPAS